MTIARIGATLLISTTVLLSACGGGGGGGTPPPTNNLSAKSLQVVTPDPRIAYPLQVSVSIEADQAADNVSVSVFAMEKSDDPAAQIHQTPLGTQTIPHVDAGTHSYELDVNIPSSVQLPGPYYIGAIVDPVNEVAETNEDDNTTSVEATLSAEGTPNIVLTEMTLDRAALVINTDTYEDQVPGTAGNVHNADAGGTITVGADGLGPNDTIDIEAFANLRIIRSDTGTSYDVPLYLWDSDADRYTDAYGKDPSTNSTTQVEWLPLGQFTPQLVETAGEDVTLNDVKRNSAHMNFYFPGKLGSELVIAMRHLFVTLSDPNAPPPDLTPAAISGIRGFLRNLPGPTQDAAAIPAAMAVMSFAVCVDIRPADPSVVDRDPADNEQCSPLSITLPPFGSPPIPPPPPIAGFTPQLPNPTGPLSSGDAYGTKGGGSVFAFGPIDFGATTSGDNRGYIEEIRGGIPVTIFGKFFDFMSVTVRAQLVPDYNGKPDGEESGFTIELRFLNTLLDSVKSGPISSPKLDVTYSEEAPAKEEDAEQQLFIGPVPVVAGGVVGGNIGVAYEFNFTGSPNLFLGNTAGPLANLEAVLHAGVGTKLFSVGVEGVLTLLEESLEFVIGTAIHEFNSGFSTSPAEFVITQGETLSNVFTGPRGALNLYAKYTVPKLVTCNWGFIKGQCIKAAMIKATKNIWRSPALFELNDILYQNTGVQLERGSSGQAPMYYGP